LVRPQKVQSSQLRFGCTIFYLKLLLTFGVMKRQGNVGSTADRS